MGLCHFQFTGAGWGSPWAPLEPLQSPGLQDTCNSPNKLLHVPPLLRDLPWNLIGPHGVIVWLLAKPKVIAQVDQGQGDAKPHAEQGQHGGERNLESEYVSPHTPAPLRALAEPDNSGSCQPTTHQTAPRCPVLGVG